MPRFGARPACRRGGIDWRTLWRAMTSGHGISAGGRRHRHGGVPHGPGHGFWFGPGGGFPFGPGGPWGRRRGPRARRGDVRTAALLLLAEAPRNGYQIMQELEARSGGAWRPSPGSVYPALQQLEDEGLIRSREHDGRKRYELTDDGRRYVEERDDDAPAPWDLMADVVSDDAWAPLRTAREVGMALLQVMETGSEAQRREAQRILTAARRDLYRLLAEGEPREDDADDAARD